MSIIGKPKVFRDAINVLKGLSPSERKNFSLPNVIIETGCGTSACGMGWLALKNFRPVIDNWPGLGPNISRHMAYTKLVNDYNVRHYYDDAAMDAFDILSDVAHLLFTPEGQALDGRLPDDATVDHLVERMEAALTFNSIASFGEWCLAHSMRIQS